MCIASFIAYKRKGYPKEATHFRILSNGSLLNFRNNSYSYNIQSSDLLPLSRKTPGDICLEHQLNGKPGDVLVQAVGIQLYKLVSGEEVLIKGGAVRILEAKKKGNEATRHQGNKGEGVEEKGKEVLKKGIKVMKGLAHIKALADQEATRHRGKEASKEYRFASLAQVRQHRVAEPDTCARDGLNRDI